VQIRGKFGVSYTDDSNDGLGGKKKTFSRCLTREFHEASPRVCYIYRHNEIDKIRETSSTLRHIASDAINQN